MALKGVGEWFRKLNHSIVMEMHGQSRLFIVIKQVRGATWVALVLMEMGVIRYRSAVCRSRLTECP